MGSIRTSGTGIVHTSEPVHRETPVCGIVGADRTGHRERLRGRYFHVVQVNAVEVRQVDTGTGFECVAQAPAGRQGHDLRATTRTPHDHEVIVGRDGDAHSVRCGGRSEVISRLIHGGQC